MGRQLLIVNADDWGATPHVTDSILRAFRAGAITSTTAMVFMQDSERAARLALEHGVPTGLHLNLIEEFDGPHVPAVVAERHRRLREHFADLPRRRWRFSRRARHDIAAEIETQVGEYRRLYGRSPEHLDSHHHAHVCPDVLASRSLPAGTKVRQTRSIAPGQGLSAQAIASRAKARAIALRFRTTSRFWAVHDVHPAIGGVGFEAALRAGENRTVEVMVHPGFVDELPLLLADDWLAYVAAGRPGTYADLEPDPAPRSRASAIRLPG